jgi:hypothetical protein
MVKTVKQSIVQSNASFPHRLMHIYRMSLWEQKEKNLLTYYYLKGERERELKKMSFIQQSLPLPHLPHLHLSTYPLQHIGFIL